MHISTRWLGVPEILLLGGCMGGGFPDAGTDGGFSDAPVVIVPPTRVVDESGDLDLVLSVRLIPGETSRAGVLLGEVEFTAYDDTTGAVVFVRVEDAPDPRALVGGYVGLPDPRTGVLELWFNGADGSGVRADYDLLSESWLEPLDVFRTEGSWSLDFGAFTVSRCEDSGDGGHETRIFGRTEVSPFCYQPGAIFPPIGPRASVVGMWRGPGGTLILDARRYTAPELVQNDLGRFDPERMSWESDYALEFMEHRIEDVRDVFLVEPETGYVVGLGERRLPEAPYLFVRRPLDQNTLSDRRGRVHFRDGAAVTSEPIYRAGIDGTIDEVTLDWGDATECLLTSIVEVGPEGHILTQQRPEEERPTGVVCVFAPDGTLVLSLPADPERAWAGFSDPVQWY